MLYTHDVETDSLKGLAQTTSQGLTRYALLAANESRIWTDVRHCVMSQLLIWDSNHYSPPLWRYSTKYVSELDSEMDSNHQRDGYPFLFGFSGDTDE
jgi:hypothetical protein